MGEVRWSDEADVEFDRYADWIWREAATADAVAWLGALLDWIEQLSDFPRIGTPRDDLNKGLRTRAFRKSVVVAYTVDDVGDVTILRVLSHGRDISPSDFSTPE